MKFKKKVLQQMVMCLTNLLLVTIIFYSVIGVNALDDKKRGDIDGDGNITANDALLVLRASVGLEDLSKYDDTSTETPNYETDTSIKEDLGIPSYEYEITVFDVGKTEWDNVYANAVVGVKNTGTNNINLGWGAEFDVEDENNKLVDTLTGRVVTATPVIAPGEVGYYCLECPDDFSGDPSKTYHLVPSFTDISVTKSAPVTFEVVDLSYKTEKYETPSIMGRVVNNTTKDYEWVIVQCVFYNSQHEIIDVKNQTISVPANSKKSFEIGEYYLYCMEREDEIASYEVTAMARSEY